MTMDDVYGVAVTLLLAFKLAEAALSSRHRTPPAFMVPFWKLEVVTSG